MTNNVQKHSSLENHSSQTSEFQCKIWSVSLWSHNDFCKLFKSGHTFNRPSYSLSYNRPTAFSKAHHCIVLLTEIAVRLPIQLNHSFILLYVCESNSHQKHTVCFSLCALVYSWWNIQQAIILKYRLYPTKNSTYGQIGTDGNSKKMISESYSIVRR